MRLVRYRPGVTELPSVRPFDMQNRIQKMLTEMLGPIQAEDFGWAPQVDVVENDTELVIRADLPGVKKDDVQLEIGNGMLVLKGEKKEEKEVKDAQYRMVERSYGAFERSFALPSSVDADKIRADFRNGVLEVHLPKTEKAVGRKVVINDE
jgi:HSP20 family protein